MTRITIAALMMLALTLGLAAQTSSAPVNLNTATAAELEGHARLPPGRHPRVPSGPFRR